MMGLRPRQGNLRLVFRLFKSYALDYLSLMLGKPHIRLNNLKTSLRFPCLGLNPIIDSINIHKKIQKMIQTKVKGLVLMAELLFPVGNIYVIEGQYSIYLAIRRGFPSLE